MWHHCSSLEARPITTVCLFTKTITSSSKEQSWIVCWASVCSSVFIHSCIDVCCFNLICVCSHVCMHNTLAKTSARNRSRQMRTRPSQRKYFLILSHYNGPWGQLCLRASHRDVSTSRPLKTQEGPTDRMKSGKINEIQLTKLLQFAAGVSYATYFGSSFD